LISLTRFDEPKLKKLNNKVFIIPNSISFTPIQSAKLENKTILSIGRLDYLKGYDLLIEVFERYCRSNKDWKLRIIGDGPLREQITKIIIEKGLTNRISLITMSNTIMEEYLNASIYVMTSRSEGLPMVLLEAQAFGLPIVAFDCETGPSEIIQNGISGYLIANYDIDEMKEKLIELSNNPLKRIEFGKNALENIKRFHPEEIFYKWEMVFRELEQRN
jgi:glycosyltransferase involved in cell wall biosynthesis